MIVIASRSSTTARVSRNVRRPEGRWVLISARMATANAMSVAVGIAQPCRAPESPRFQATKNAAGTSIPPRAATTGSAARRGSRKSPATNSRLSSRPATKKKMASSPSAAHVPRLRSRCSEAGPTSRLRRSTYASDQGVFAHTTATMAASRRSRPPVVSARSTCAIRELSRNEPLEKSGRFCWISDTSDPSGSAIGDCRPAFPAHRAHRTERVSLRLCRSRSPRRSGPSPRSRRAW